MRVLFILLLLLPSLARADGGPSATEPAAEEPSGQEVRGGALVDHDYAFQLRPVSGASPLDEPQARQRNTEAVAGQDLGALFSLVLVENLGEHDGLDAYADALIELLDLAGSELLFTRRAEIDGVPALRYAIEGISNGVTARVDGLIAIRRGFGYHLTVVSVLEREGVAVSRDALLGAFGFLDREPRVRAESFARPDEAGAGWVLESGVFRDAVLELEVRPASSAHRVLLREELQDLNDDADVGLLFGDTGAAAILLAERLGPDAQGQATSILASFEQGDDGAAPHPRLTWTVFGAPRPVAVLESEEQVRYLVAVARDGILYRVYAWHSLSEEDGAAQVEAGMASFGFLSQQAKPETLARARAIGGALVLDEGTSWRGGRWRSFSTGIVWSLPERGIWKLTQGEEAVEYRDTALLVLEEREQEVYLMLTQVPGAAGLRRAHALAVADLGGAAGRRHRVVVDGRPALRTDSRTVWRGAELSWQVTTVSAPSGVYTLYRWGRPERVAAAASALEEAVAGFRFRPPEPPLRIGDGLVDDQRTGVRIDLSGGWRCADQTGEHLRAIGFQAVCAAGPWSLLMVAVWSPGSPEAGERVALRAFRDLDPALIARRDLVIDGRPAALATHPASPVSLAYVVHDGVMLALVADGPGFDADRLADLMAAVSFPR